MKYYIDTEFLEGTQKEKFPISLFRKETANTIDLISIGIVAEDGREYYAVSKDFNLKEAWNRFDWKQRSKEDIQITPALGTIYKEYWIRENVLLPIYKECICGDMRNKFLFTYNTMKWILENYGKTNKQIAEEIKEFCLEVPRIQEYGNPQFYGYYCDYDWVVFCWLFGKEIDLPKEFPMYCIDLKQMLENAKLPIDKDLANYIISCLDCKTEIKWKHLEYVYEYENINMHPNYPKQTNEHNALLDARWNKQLHEFLLTI